MSLVCIVSGFNLCCLPVSLNWVTAFILLQLFSNRNAEVDCTNIRKAAQRQLAVCYLLR